MAFTTFKTRDGQRFRKVYPRIRKSPRSFTISDEPMVVESTKVTLSNSVNGSYNFQTKFTTIPNVQISAQPSDDAQGMVNIFITSLTTNSVTFETSAPFSGIVHIQIIKIG
tara:strand:- start:2632 stop:2964 length:333 start_codon:yes stop_codon:yes gene_type:complete